MSNLTRTFQKERNLRRKALINQPKKTLPLEIQENDITWKDHMKFFLAVASFCVVLGCVAFTLYVLAYVLAP